MHELSIAQNLVKIASQYAEENKAEKVKKVYLVIGTFSGVEVEALTFCFPIAAEGTICEKAELSIELEQGKGRCEKCGKENRVNDLMSPCPDCGHWPLKIEGGNEMVIKSLEVR